MKRILAITMTLAMLLGLMTIGASATYADDENRFTNDTAQTGNNNSGQPATDFADDTIGSKDVDVNITSTASDYTNVYAITYSTTDLTFTYQASSSYIWDPVKLQYVSSGTSDGTGWLNDEQELTVTNYSDLPVDVAASYTAESEVYDVTVAMGLTTAPTETSTVNMELGDAIDKTPKTDTLYVKVSGTPNVSGLSAEKIGTITLTVTKHVEGP